LEAASIETEDVADNKKTSTDSYGNFTIKINGTKARLKATFIGYKSVAMDVSGNTTLKIELQPITVNLEDVIITPNGGFQKFNAFAKVDLDLKPVKNTQELLQIVPGLFVAQHAGGGKAEQIFLRGFDCDHGTDIQVSVDGLPVNMVSHAHVCNRISSGRRGCTGN